MTNPSRTLVRRGGSWLSFTTICRPTYRSSFGDAKQSSRQLGFRVVCLPQEVAPPPMVLRGGFWGSYPKSRLTYRALGGPGLASYPVGFRVVCLPREVAPSRVLLRGGTWFLYPGGCRSAFRRPFGPDDADGYFGFRVVCLPREVTP